MTAPEEEVVRRLRQLAGVGPGAAATARALDRARAALAAAGARPPRPRAWPRRIKMLLKVAAGILVVVGLSNVVSLQGPGAGGLAFAQVQERLKEVRSVTGTHVLRRPGQPDEEFRLLILENGLVRVEQPDGGYTVTDTRKHRALLVTPAKKQATVLEGLATRPPADLYGLLRDAPRRAVRRLPGRELEGRRAVGYVVRVDEAGLAGGEFTVWVDPTTGLPFRFEATEKDDKGRPVQVLLTELVYDVRLDPDLFSLKPPADYAVTRHGLAELPPEPDIKALREPEVRPGVGLGPVKFGMSKQQVIELLGKPDKEEARGTGLSYLSRGYALTVSPARGVLMISCFTQQTFAIRVRDFRGKTAEGVAMGSTRADVEKASGKPDKVETNGPATTYLEYHKKGLHFVLFDGKVVQLTLHPVR